MTGLVEADQKLRVEFELTWGTEPQCRGEETKQRQLISLGASKCKQSRNTLTHPRTAGRTKCCFKCPFPTE